MAWATNAPAAIAALETQTMAKKHYLTATLGDGYIKTIGPTTLDFTHYWRIVAQLGNGKTEVFWGHAKSLAEARKKHTAARDAAAQRGWADYVFEVVELERTPA